jgi:hypothetical protein
MKTKTIFIGIIILILGFGAYYFLRPKTSVPEPVTTGTSPTTKPTPIVNSPTPEEDKSLTVLGKSVQGRSINAYHFGTGTTEILFVGGIHGGYEWNTSLLAYELIDYLKLNPDVIPKNEMVTVIPVLNPDGLTKVTGVEGRFTVKDVNSSESIQVAGRFNANNIDLNRNFDCDWKKTGVWQNKQVNGGESVFSEPESQAFKSYIQARNPSSVVAWFSAAGGVYASNCDGKVLPETSALTKIFSQATGYKGYEKFNSYALTGDMTNWLATINIPTISILLTNHTDTEWTKNLAGITAILKHYTK